MRAKAWNSLYGTGVRICVRARLAASGQMGKSNLTAHFCDDGGGGDNGRDKAPITRWQKAFDANARIISPFAIARAKPQRRSDDDGVGESPSFAVGCVMSN